MNGCSHGPQDGKFDVLFLLDRMVIGMPVTGEKNKNLFVFLLLLLPWEAMSLDIVMNLRKAILKICSKIGPMPDQTER